MNLPLPPRFRTAVSLLILSFNPLSAMATDLAEVLPGDAVLFAEIRSVPELLKAREHPFVKSVGKSGLAPLFGEFLKGFGAGDAGLFEKETGLTLAELSAKFTGGIAMGAEEREEGKAPPKAGAPDPAGESGVLFVADFTGDEALLEKLFSIAAKWKTAPRTEKSGTAAAKGTKKPFAVWPEQYEEAVTEMEGVKAHVWTLKDSGKTQGGAMSWALVEGRAFVSLGEGVLKEGLQRLLAKSTDGGLSRAPLYLESRAAAGDWDLLAGMDVEKVLKLGVSVFVQKAEEKDSASQKMMTVQQLWKGMGFLNLRKAFTSLDLRPEQVGLAFGATYTEKPAILDLYAAKGSGEVPLFVPAGRSEVMWGTLDWGGFFDAFTSLVSSINPAYKGQLEFYAGMMKGTSGVDVRKDLFGRMGDNWWVVSRAPEPGKDGIGSESKDKTADSEEPGALSLPPASNVAGVALRDSAAFELSLKSLLNALAPGTSLFEDRDYLGNSIHRLKNPPDGMEISWLVKDDTLILSLGGPDLLDQVLAGMAKKPAAPLLDQEAVKAAFEGLPGDPVGTALNDAGYFITGLLAGAENQMTKNGVENDLTAAIAKLPRSIELPYFLASRVYISEKSAQIRARFSPKP